MRSIEEGAEAICRAIETALENKTGCLIGRNGTIELQVVFSKMNSSIINTPIHLAKTLELHAGVWPSTNESIHDWYLELLNAIRSSDVIVAGWYEPFLRDESRMLDIYATNVTQIPLRSLEPYYVPPEKRWTQLLKGHVVAIVNAFAETAFQQTMKAEDLWPGQEESLLPQGTTWIPVRTGYAPILAQGRAEWSSHLKNWQEAVESVVEKVIASNARIALIGCGGLGMPIAARLKERGVIAIVLGGATQVLFGIKGKRWESHSVIKHFWNEDWVCPATSETPKGSKLIEGGCYWA